MYASRTTLGLLSACILCIRLAMPDATAATVPEAESFESYSPGYVITNEVDWSGASSEAGVVSTNAAAINALTTYTGAGGVLPLPAATHDQVLAVNDSLTNTVSSAADAVVITEWLVMPTLREAADSPGDDNYQTAFYLNSDTNIVIWRRDLAPTETNDWLVLANTPTIELAEWMRVTLTLDYATDRYQLAIDGTPISDPEGEQRDTTPNGTWFNMVQTNGAMARFRAEATIVTYVDDLVFTNRSLSYSGSLFSEPVGNDGSIATTHTITLANDTFVSGLSTSDVSAVGVPDGLNVSLTRTGDTTAELTFNGNADAPHTSDETVDFAFLDTAFTLGSAASVVGYTNTLTLDFNDGPLGLGWSPTSFTEDTPNNGTIGNTVTATISGTTLATSGTLTAPTHYSITSGAVPSGLALSISSDGDKKLTLSLGSSASPHTSSQDGSFVVTFENTLFVEASAADPALISPSLSVTFDDQPEISYSGTVFSELVSGVIDNASPIEITLSGDTFDGANGSDFVAAGKVTTNNIPAGLTLTLTKSSDTKLLARLIGAATANSDPGDDVDTLTITFKDAAFTAADADQVTGYSRTNLEVDFNNNTLVINSTPYSESFEGFADGYGMGIVQGWQPHGSPVVTTESTIVNALKGDFTQFPLETTHEQVLRMTEETTVEIVSPSGGDLYTDAMLYVTARDTAPGGSPDYQVAFYVNSSEKLVLWHDPGTVGQWLETGTTVTTGAWHRFTVKQDQTEMRYQLYLDGAVAPVSDAAGYAGRTGSATSGSWFGMVNTSGFMSRIRVVGADTEVPAYLDDLVVRQTRPEYLSGTLFMFR